MRGTNVNAVFYDIDNEVMAHIAIEGAPPDRFKLPFVRNGTRRIFATEAATSFETIEFELLDVHFERNLARYRRST